MEKNSLKNWLNSLLKGEEITLFPLKNDASFRTYFRINHQAQSFIAVDAAAEREKIPQFIHIANLLRQQDIPTPIIQAADLEQGFLLITDFGDEQLLKILHPDNANELYEKALITLARLASTKTANFPPFTEGVMRQELNLFQEWFLEKYLKLNLNLLTKNTLALQFDLIAKLAAMQPIVFMHRDYHAANLMRLPNNAIGVLDFQDAFVGPVTYDVVSLLRDCYIDWPKEAVAKWLAFYWQQIDCKEPFATFSEWFDVMGLQRHLKALLTFSRKFVRDKDPHYLAFIPRTLKYLLQESQANPAFKPLHDFLQQEILPRIQPQIGKRTKQRAMILAAGKGERMGHLTASIPKALLKLHNRYLIEYSIYALKNIGIDEIVINICYFKDKIKAALGDGSRYGVTLVYSEEEEALETGGGIYQALPLLGSQPFIVLSCDIVSDFPLAQLPKEPRELAHLVLVKNPDFHPEGDFGLVDQQVVLPAQQKFTFGNIGVYHPDLFADCQPGKFRLGDLLKAKIPMKVITGELFQGFWHNFGTPHQLENMAALPDTLP